MKNPVKKQPTGDYPVGYCRPPESGRWGKGESGNRRGRPRKQAATTVVDFLELLREALATTVSAREGEKEIRLTLRELAIRTLVMDLMKGTASHRLKLIKELREMGAMDADPSSRRSDPEAVRKFVERLGEEARRMTELEQQFSTPLP